MTAAAQTTGVPTPARSAGLFSPLTLRGLTLRNRIVISPMCQYSAADGFSNDFHLVHLGRFAMGGAGLVFTEAVAASAQGRITHGDLGLWDDAQAEGLRRVVQSIQAHGAAAGIQLSHAGRKASMQRPWFGNGPLNEADESRGDRAWPVVAPSAVKLGPDWLTPEALDLAGLEKVRQEFLAAASRAVMAGFDVLELHCAHGYLLHQFLSPLSNQRNDAYGGSRENRMRFPLEVAGYLRALWPADKPMFVRISAVDNVEGGVRIEDSIDFSQRLAALGIDVVDCSSGGMLGSATASAALTSYGYQVPLAAQIKSMGKVQTMAVGLIVDPHQADAIVANGEADLVAIGRAALDNPNWPYLASKALQRTAAAPEASVLLQAHGWWLARRASLLAKLGDWQGA